MILKILLATTLLALAPIGDDLESEIDGLLFRLETAEQVNRWPLANELQAACLQDSITTVPYLVKRGNEVSVDVTLVVAQVLIDLDAPDHAVSLLLPMATVHKDREAISLLGHRAFKDVDEVAGALTHLMADTQVDLLDRVMIARSLFRTSRRQTRTAAHDFLLETLQSENYAVQVEAAFALAEIKDYDAARPVLQVVAKDPGNAGRLARAYIETDDKIRYFIERQIRYSQPQQPLATSEAVSGPGSLDVLEELIQKIQQFHLMGDQLVGPEGREHLITAAARGMLGGLDPHSTFFSSKNFERWILDLRRNYAGIGAYVDTVDDWFTVTRPIYSGPAYQAGLESGDRIIEVDGWPTFGHDNDEIIRRLKGEPGTEVTVSIWRDGWEEFQEFAITREVIHIPSVTHNLLPADLGLIEVASFSEGVTQEIMNALSEMKDQGMRGLILDLRNNSGGYMNEAVSMVSLFTEPSQLVVYTEGRNVEREDYYSSKLPMTWDGPLVVLVNDRSASASEIVSGALQVEGRAPIIGEKTFGKGSVQQAMELKTRPGDELLTDKNYNRVYDPGDEFEDSDHNGQYTYPSNVKLTNARYYLADGTSIHTERDIDGRVLAEGGVKPDEEVIFNGLEPWENNELAALFRKLRDEYRKTVSDSGNEDTPLEIQYKDAFARYVDEHWEEHRDLFHLLAESDGLDPLAYPDFESFADSLNTHLPADTIRRMIRIKIRDYVADDRGVRFPGFGLVGDWQEDSQLQVGIRRLLNDLSMDPASVPSYLSIAKVLSNEVDDGSPVGSSPR